MVVQLTLALNANPTVVTAVRPMPANHLTHLEHDREAAALHGALLALPIGTLSRLLQRMLHDEVRNAELIVVSDKSPEAARNLNRLRLAYQSLCGNHRHDADAADHADTLTSLADGQGDELGQVLKAAAEYLRRV